MLVGGWGLNLDLGFDFDHTVNVLHVVLNTVCV